MPPHRESGTQGQVLGHALSSSFAHCRPQSTPWGRGASPFWNMCAFVIAKRTAQKGEVPRHFRPRPGRKCAKLELRSHSHNDQNYSCRHGAVGLAAAGHGRVSICSVCTGCRTDVAYLPGRCGQVRVDAWEFAGPAIAAVGATFAAAASARVATQRPDAL